MQGQLNSEITFQNIFKMERNSHPFTHLILTLDYELYGDGSGSVFDTMIDPTNNYLRVCKKYGIRTTIFFEVMEYLRMKELWDSGNTMGYEENPVKAIADQLKQAYLEGHDIQLHIHPHWVNATYENNRWNPDSRYWKLTRVPLTPDEHFPISLEELILRGKEGVEAVIQEIDPNYVCNIFRAGGFSITPSEDIVKVLLKLGFEADSSVIPGAYIDNEYYSYDFSHLSLDKPYWMVKKAVEQQEKGNEELIELPIFSKSMVRFQKYDRQRIRVALQNKRSNIGKIKDKVEGRNSALGKIKFFLEKEHLTWDFCLFSKGKMQKFLKYAREIATNGNHPFHPFVLIGHSKEFIRPEAFENFVQSNEGSLGFITLKEAVHKIKNELTSK